MPTTPVDYDLLAAFVAVADENSFSKAARRLGIGKGTVSRAIARLERAVGAELIHRTTHKVSLSTAGTALYERTAPHLAALAQAVGKLPESAAQPSGELRMTVPYDLGAIVLPELLAQFSLRYPEITFDIHLTNAVVDLVGEGFDVAIRASPARMKDSSLTSRRLGEVSMGYYAAPSYVARRGEPRHVGDPAHEWVAFARMELPKGLRPRFRCDEFVFLRTLLRDGVGVGPLPSFVAEPDVVSGALVPVMRHERLRGSGGVFLVYPSSGSVPRKVTAFRDFVVERLQARPLAAG